MSTAKENADEEVDLDNLILKARSYYDILPPNTPGLNRLQFNESLEEIISFFRRIGKKYNQKITEKDGHLHVLTKERDIQLRNWMERYNGISKKWKECLNQLVITQSQLGNKVNNKIEKIMKNSQKTPPNTADIKKRRKLQRKFFQSKIALPFLEHFLKEIQCENGSIFMKKGEYMVTIACICPNSTRGGGLQIVIPRNKGLVSWCYKKRSKIVVKNAYREKRFYASVDRDMGITTKSLMCYPLLSEDGKDIFGVLEITNKLNNGGIFTKDDEDLMEKKCNIFARLFEPVFGLYSKKEIEFDKLNGSLIGDGEFHKGKRKTSSRVGGNGKEEPTENDKRVDDFVTKLNTAWKKSIKERGKLQSQLAALQAIQDQNDKDNSRMKTELRVHKTLTKEIAVKLDEAVSKFKKKRKEWKEEKKMVQKELNKIKLIYSHFLEQSKIPVPDHLKPMLKQRLLPKMEKRKNQLEQTTELLKKNKKYVMKRNSISKLKSLKKRSNRTSLNFFKTVFELSPAPMIILNRNHKIWYTNTRFKSFLKSDDVQLLGLKFSDIALGVEEETLGRLFKFDIVQGLALTSPDRKIVNGLENKDLYKVSVSITQIGNETTEFDEKVKGPLYLLVFKNARYS